MSNLPDVNKAIEWYIKSAKTTNSYEFARKALERLGQPIPTN